MVSMLIEGGEVLTAEGLFNGSVLIKEGFIHGLSPDSVHHNPEEFTEVLDASGCFVSPGLIDLQVNGGADCNLWQTVDGKALDSLTNLMFEHGVSTFLPTLITDSIDSLVRMRRNLRELGVGDRKQLSPEISSPRMPGIHLEGPFLSGKNPGVHPPQYVQPPSIPALEKLVGKGDEVLLMTMACEEDPDGASLAWLKEKGIPVSLGHTNASFEEANTAFDRGVRLTTHLFNAMPSFHHRKPGVVGAALLARQVSCCLIADGLHLNPATVDMIYRLKGVQNTVLVTDIAYVGTTGGDLVGSSITLDEAVRNLVAWNVASFEDAVRMASLNPACAVGLDSHIGSIEPGKLADLILWDRETLDIKSVLISGKLRN